MKYTDKKGIVVEAMQFIEESKNQCYNFVTCNRYARFDKKGRPTLKIETPIGDAIAHMGDWVVKDTHGGFFVWEDQEFVQVYTPSES